MPNYYAKNPLQSNRQMKVQKLSIPFKIVGSATSANVSITCDEPGFAFFKTEGNDQITAAVPSGETATFSVGPSDSSGIFNVLVVIQEPVKKVISCRMSDSVTGTTTNACKLGSSSGIPTAASGNAAGTAIMLTATSALALNAANTCNGTIEVEYFVLDRLLS